MTLSRSLRLLLAGFFLLNSFTPTAFCQLPNHGNIWHFGYRSGLDFSSGNPVPLADVEMDSWEGCASYCDANGQLLFYTNGGGFKQNSSFGPRKGIIWNRNQQVMYDMGDNKGGGYSAPQSAIAFPKPGSSTAYYLFTMDDMESISDVDNRGLSFFEIDMTANAGLGGVAQADVRVFTPASECLSAVPHKNGTDFWVITVDSNSLDFVLLPVTATGVGVPQMRARAEQDNVSVIKISPDGRFIFADEELYTFDATTGQITFKEHLPLSSYTFSFSPESRYLYGIETDTNISGAIVRYDLLMPNVLNSNELVDPGTSFSFGGLMQLGADGNIYYNEQTESDFINLTESVSVIRCPDGSSPTLERSLFQFPTDPDNFLGFYTSLPNFADYIFASSKVADTIKITQCKDELLTLSAEGQGLSFLWSNGETTATIIVSDPGTYTVKVSDACGIKTTIFEVKKGAQFFGIEWTPFTDTCSVFPLTLYANHEPGGTIRWSDGSMLDSLVINSFGTYVANFITNCGQVKDTFTLAEPVEKCCRSFTPNAFTPNGDGANDTFIPGLPGCDVKFAEMFVWSRWGELIFQSIFLTDRWDGTTLNGVPAPSDVYVYRFQYQLNGEEETMISGEVTLLR